MQQQFFISLKIMLQNDEGKVLFLVKERLGKRFLDLPGGRMEGNENFEVGIKRELREELYLKDDIKILKQIGAVWEFPSELVKVGNRRLIITFLVETDISQLKLSDEHIDQKWIGLEDIENLPKDGLILLKGFESNLRELFM